MLERQVETELDLNLYQIHDKDFMNVSKKTIWVLHFFIARFLILSIIDILSQIIVAGGSPVLCRMLSSISGSYPLDAGSTIQPVTKKICSDIVRCPSGAKLLPVESHSSDFSKFFFNRA